jgi:AcrR family transcriptional regulator
VSKGLQARRYAHTRAEIQAAAFDLFERNGFDSVTIDQIAERAGISARTYFRYFESKSDLVFGMITEPIERIAAALESRPEGEAVGPALRAALHDGLDSMDDAGVAGLRRASMIMRGAESLRALASSAMPARERRLEVALQTRLHDAEDASSARFLATSLNVAMWIAMDSPGVEGAVPAPDLAARVLTIIESWRSLLE